MQEMANAWPDEPAGFVGSKRALYASLLAGLAFAGSTVAYALAWLNAEASQLCFDLGDVGDPQCPDRGGPSSLLTAARWTAWLVAAGLSIAAVVVASRARRGRGSERSAWLCLLGVVLSGLAFSALVLTGPIATS